MFEDLGKQYANQGRYKATIRKCNVCLTINIAIKGFLEIFLGFDACKRESSAR